MAPKIVECFGQGVFVDNCNMQSLFFCPNNRKTNILVPDVHKNICHLEDRGAQRLLNNLGSAFPSYYNTPVTQDLMHEVSSQKNASYPDRKFRDFVEVTKPGECYMQLQNVDQVFL